MRKNICFLVLLTINFIGAQTKSSDYFIFYKGGDKYLKPVKYLMFDSNRSDNIKKEIKGLTYFQIEGQRFKFDIKENKKDTCSIDILNKLKLENAVDLQKKGYIFFKKKKEEVEKEKNVKLIYPPAGYQPYFKIYLLEKIDNNKLIKYEVDWEYSNF